MKRIVIAFILGCFVTLLPLRAGAVELEFWTTEIHEDRIQAITFLLRAFMVMRDGVSVKLVSVDENELFERMKRAKERGGCPHLIGADSHMLAALSQLGLLDREVATQAVSAIGKERFYAGPLELVSAPDGKGWYGVPLHGWVQGIWYRADWFKGAGLAPPETWEAIRKAAKHFTDPVSGRYGILIGTAPDHYADQVFTQVAASNGASLFDAEGNVVFDSPAMVEALEYYVSLAKYAPAGAQSWRARDYFMQGRLAMMFYSTFIMDDLALARVAQDSLGGENFSELEGADFDPDMVYKVGMVSSVSHTQKAGYGMVNGFGVKTGLTQSEREAVLDFLAFLYEPDHYISWLHMAPGGMLPVLRDIAGANSFLADPSGIFRRYGRDKIEGIIKGLASISRFGHDGGNRSSAASMVYAKKIIPRMISRAIHDGVSPEEAVARAAREVEAVVRSGPDAATSQ